MSTRTLHLLSALVILGSALAAAWAARDGQRARAYANLLARRDRQLGLEGARPDIPLVETGEAAILTMKTNWALVHGEVLLPVQRGRLAESFEAYVRLYAQANFARYKAFRLSHKYHVQRRAFDRTVRLAQGIGTTLPPRVGSARELEMAWYAVNRTNWINMVAQQPVSVRIVTSDRLRNPFILAYPFGFVEYDPSVEAVLTAEGTVTIAILSFLGQSTGQKRPTQRAVSFYWDPSSRDWLPWDQLCSGDAPPTLF